MKKTSFILHLIVFLFISGAGIAQYQEADAAPARPRWVSEKGYWVVESNVKTPQNSIVNFYTNDQKLIYSEKVTGKVLNTKKRRTLMKLKRALDKVITDWETTGVVKASGELTALLTGKK